MCARGRLSRQPAADVNVLVFPDNAAARHLQPHSDPGDGQLGGDGVLADEFPFAQLYGKVQSRLQRRDLVVELVAVERHGRLQAQGIPSPQPAGDEPQIFPCLQQQVPEGAGIGIGAVELIAEFTSVPRAGDQAPDPLQIHIFHKAVVFLGQDGLLQQPQQDFL